MAGTPRLGALIPGFVSPLEYRGNRAMTENGKEVAKAAAVAGVGAGVGGAGGASVGVLELAAQGAATGLTAGVVIGVGAAAGALVFLWGYTAYRNFRKLKSERSK